MKTFRGNTGRVLKHLQEKGKITSMEAFELYGATRLSAIVFNLRKNGYKIESEKSKSFNRYGDKVYFATYVLKEE